MLGINMKDVMDFLATIQTHLIVFGVVLAVALITMIAVIKLPKPTKKLIRGEAAIAIVLALVIVVNLVCYGPAKTLLDLVSGSGAISEESMENAYALCEDIAEEGIVLLENDSALPLASDAKLNVFGWASTNPCYGGTGSGSLNRQYETTTLLQGLANAGITTNEELSNFYVEYKADRPGVGMGSQDWTLPEPNVNLYTDEMIENAKAFSDTAMIVFTRVGGEGADLPTDMTAVVDGTWISSAQEVACYRGTYDDTLNEGNDWDEGDTFLNLTNREEELVELVCANFENVIVLYNGANAMELGFVEDYPQIKGVLWAAGMGQSGFNGLGNILTGAVNPSGRLVDTYVYDHTAAPNFNNFGNFTYTNMDEFMVEQTMFGKNVLPNFVNYVEGIYVGYKFYETAAAEGLINYDEVVQYPFGYGLSYTSFTQEMGTISESDGTITFDVTVTNTGSVAGKDVVEVYYNPPYTNGGIEKATANLVEFAKTDVLEPGDSQVITITFDVEDMASFDTYGHGCYVLEKGDYVISINSDSHNVIDSEVYTLNADIVYDEGRASDVTPATVQFGFAEGNVTYLSRADGFANYEIATAAPSNFEMDAESKAGFYNISNYLTAEATAADEDPNAEAIKTGVDAGIDLVAMRGVAYDDAQWETFLDQLTLEEMTSLIALGGYQTAAIDSIGKVRTNDCDGPASINNNFTGQGSIGLPSGVVVAASFNKDLAEDFGESIGQMADEMDVSGWYAPAMNIHRSAFAGRNFEYYSEDAFLSGTIAAQSVKGAEKFGVYAYVKHFALNDQEGNRTEMLCTWSTEQAIREVYLKAFEIAIKEGGADAVMSSFNYVGNRWTGGCNELCNVVLRDEWGFQGMVLTDYFGVYGYMSADQAIRNGTDFCLVNYPTETSEVRFQETAGAQQAMRQATKNILYTVVNSRAYAEENLNPAAPLWQVILTVVNVAVAALLILWQVMLIKKYKLAKAATVETVADNK